MQKYYSIAIALIFAVLLSGSYIDNCTAATISGNDTDTSNLSNDINEFPLNILNVQNTINNVVTIIITGIVKTCTSGDPFEGVTITFKSLSGEILGTTTTDSNGFYQIVFQCTEDMFQSLGTTFQVTASYPGHISSTKDITVAPIETTASSSVTNSDSSTLYGDVNFQLGSLLLTKGSWDTVGIDANDPWNNGPYQGLVQIHITNNATTTATNVWASFNFTDTNNQYIWYSPNQNYTKYIGDLAPGETKDVFFLVNLNNTTTVKKPKATRNYIVSVWGDNTDTNSTINGTLLRDGFQEQSRNYVKNITFSNTTAIHTGDIFNVYVKYSTASDYETLMFMLLHYDPSIVRLLDFNVNWMNGTVNSTSNDTVLHRPGAGTDYYSIWTFQALKPGTTSFAPFIDDISGESSHYNTDYIDWITVLNVTPKADVASTKTVSNLNRPGETIQYNDLINYVIKISNYGPDNATGVNYTDLLPAGLIYINHTISTNGGLSWVANSSAYNPTSGAWNIGNISANSIDQIILSITARVNRTNTTFTNNANKTAMNEFDSNTSNDNSTVTFNVSSAADISVTKIIDKAKCKNGTTTIWPPVEGISMYYYVTVHNNGPNNATGIIVTDVLPSQLTYMNYWVSNDSGITWKAAVNLPADTYNATTGIWNVGDLNYGSPDKVLCIRGIVNANDTWINNTANKTAQNEYDWNITNDNSTANVYIPPT